MDQEILTQRYTAAEIEQKTQAIYDQIVQDSSSIDQGNFNRIGVDDLAQLFWLYDRHFFEDFFRARCMERLSFRLSQRMTRAGGKTTYYKTDRTYSIALSTELIFKTFGPVEREVVVTGRVCKDRLEATMRIVEHEMIHLLEFLLFDDSSCKQPQFRQLAGNVFGHTGFTHDLVSGVEQAQKVYNIKPGDAVSFAFEGQRHEGIVHRITKRATVLVPDDKGGLRDRQGKRYRKYYVPVQWLKAR
jgi:hypothetical protein